MASCRRMRLLLLSLTMLGSLTAFTAAQITYDPNNSQLYQGQDVTSVEVIANPHLDVEPLKARLTLARGSKFSDRALQESITALKAEGNFSDVKVMMTPEAEGMQVAFVLEPAFYVGVVDFPGANKNFSYTRLMQVVNLPEQDPFNKNELPQSEAALIKFLHS